MKIAILTQPLRYNYGGILQNYALQTVLRRAGHAPVTVDVHRDKSTLGRWLFHLKWFWRSRILGKTPPIAMPESRRRFLRRAVHLQRFIDSHIDRTEYIPDYRALKRLSGRDFDAWIAGSDQVWIRKFSTATFFGFLPASAPARRYAYAASLGDDRWPYSAPTTEACRRLAARFSAISVRERSAVALCREHLGIEATHVADPTLLLTSDDYNALIADRKAASAPYIMTYLLDPSPRKTEIVRQIAQRTGLPVVDLAAASDEVVPPVERWLAGFRDAAYVVTDSFHGTAFSIIYRRQFLAIANPRRGIDRFRSLLASLALEERLIDGSGERPASLPAAEIDYTRVEELLAAERARSMAFIDRIR